MRRYVRDGAFARCLHCCLLPSPPQTSPRGLPTVPVLLPPSRHRPVSPHPRALRRATRQVPARGGVASPAVAVSRRAVQPAAGATHHGPLSPPPFPCHIASFLTYPFTPVPTPNMTHSKSLMAAKASMLPPLPRPPGGHEYRSLLLPPCLPQPTLHTALSPHPLRSLSLAVSFPFPPAATNTAPRYSPPTPPRTPPPPPATAPRVPITPTSRRRPPPRRTPRTRCSTAISTHPSPPTRYPTHACTCTPLLRLMAYPILTR